MDERAGAERGARAVLALLTIAFPAVYAWIVLTAEPVPAPERDAPTWLHLVVITVGDWPQPTAIPSQPALDRLQQHGLHVGPLFTASDDPAASAVSLWTGRHAPNHGVTSGSKALPFGAWTLAEGARRAGYRTAAFLQRPFVTRQNIAGFDALVEGEELDAGRLAELADGFLRGHVGERRLLWLHLDRAGRDLAELDRLLGAVQGTLDDLGENIDALTVVTGLTGSPRAWMEGRCRVPLLVQLPTSLNARIRSQAHLSQVDLTGVLRQLMRIANPDAGAGERPLQSRDEVMWGAMEGAEPFEWVWIEGRFGHIVRRPGLRVQVSPAAPDELPERDLRILPGAHAMGRDLPPLAPRDERAALEAYLDVRRQVYAGATEAIDALGG